MSEQGHRVPDPTRADLARGQEPVPNAQAEAIHDRTAGSASTTADFTDYLTAASDRDRSAGSAIAGFLYQALIAIDTALKLGPHDYLVIEGLEDIDVHRDPPDAAAVEAPSPTGTRRTLELLQAKYTQQNTLNWGDESVYNAVLEFLVLFNTCRGSGTPRFVFVSPAHVGDHGGFLGEWRRYGVQPTGDFPARMRSLLSDRISRLTPAEPLTLRARAALDVMSAIDLDRFARAVIWECGQARLELLHSRISSECSRRFPELRLSGTACTEILIANILFVAGVNAKNPEGRVIKASFPRECLQRAASHGQGWEQVHLLDVAANIDRKIDRVLQHNAELKAEMQDVKVKIQSLVDTSLQLQQALPRTAATSGSLGIPFDGLATTEIQGRFQYIAQCIAEGRITKALSHIDAMLTGQESIRNENAVAYLSYLRSCACSGFDQEQARDSALHAAKACSNTTWKTILTALAGFFSRDGSAAAHQRELERIAQEQVGTPMALAASIILGEMDLEADEPEAACKRVEGLGQDIRAAKIRIRGHIEHSRFADAEQIINTLLAHDDPERARYASHIAIKRFFSTYNKPHLVLPSTFRDDAREVARVLDRAYTVCPVETRYRRHEILGNQGQFLLWAGTPNEAIALLKPTIVVGGVGPEVHYILAQSYAATGHMDTAIEHAVSCAAACPPTKRALRSSALLLQAGIHLSRDDMRPLVISICEPIAASQEIPQDQRNQARGLLVRAYNGIGRSAEAHRLIEAWPAGERDAQYTLCLAILAGRNGDYDRVISLCAEHCNRPADDLTVRREALLLTGLAYWRKGDARAGANYGSQAVRLGITVEGCDIPFACYAADKDINGAAALEDYVLERDHDNLYALRSRLFRLKDHVDARVVIDPAIRLAQIASDLTDAYNACAILWCRGERSQATDLFLPWCGKCESEDHYLLASEVYAHAGKWSDAMHSILRGHDLHPGSRRVAMAAVQRVLQAGVHGVARDEYADKIRALFQAAARAYDPPILHEFQADPEKVIELVRERHRHVERSAKRYERHRYPTSGLASALGMWHPEAIYAIFHSHIVHFHNGSVPQIGKEVAEACKIDARRLLLDLPSWCMAHAIGALPAIKRTAPLVVSSAHRVLLIGYMEYLREHLVSVESGAVTHLTIGGPERPDTEQIRNQITFYKTLVEWMDRNATVEHITDPGDADGSVNDQSGARQHACVVLRGGATNGAIWPIVMDEMSMRLVPGPRLGFNILLLICRALGHMSEDAYNRLAIRSLRLGLRRLGVSFGTIISAHQLDGGRIGDNCRTVLAHMREGKWRRETLSVSAAGFILDSAASQYASMSRKDVIICVSYLLCGRSFDKKSRRKTLRLMRNLLQTQLREQSSGRPWSVVYEALETLSRVNDVIRDGDPAAHDTSMPGRRRTLGHRLPLPPGTLESWCANGGSPSMRGTEVV